MQKKLLTFDDLVKFCKKEKITTFNAKDYGTQLCVHVPAKFEVSEDEESSTLFCDVIMFHTGRNRNGSNVTEKAALNSLSTIPYKPLLADIQEIEGTDGEYDFTSHSMEVNEDGSINYIERQIGCFTADKPYLDDEADEKGRKYVHAKAAIPREYTKAADIIERKNGTKVSVELAVNAFEYDSKEKIFNFTDIEVLGCTCLGRNPKTGKEIGEGMEGSRLDISDFSIENNSISSQDKIIEVIQELKDALDTYTASFAEKNIERKEDKVELNKELFNELLVKYNKTEADITFDYSELDDDALSAAFAEAFENEENSSSEGENNTDSKDAENKNAEGVESQFDGDGNGDNTNTEITDLSENTTETPTENPSENPTTEPVTEPATEPTTEPVTEPTTDPVVNPVVTDPVQDDEEHHNSDDGSDAEYLKKIQNNEIQFAATFKGETKTFSKSLNEVINSLFELVNATYGESDNDFYDVEVFDDKKVQFYGWFTGKNYRQSYKEKDGVYSLKGDRVELFARYLTQEECDALDNLQHNFEEVSEKLAKYEAEPEKMSILESKDYASIAESDEFVAFKEKEAHFNLSVDEVRAKADQMLLDAAKAGKIEFSKNETEKKAKIGFRMFPVNTVKKGTKKYGNLLQGI